MLQYSSLTPLERERYEGEVQPYQKTDYKPIIYIYNPMSDTGCNYINLLYCNSELNVKQSIVKWKMKQAKLHNTIITLYESIDIRDGAQECIGFTYNEILTLIMNICTN